MPNHDVLFSGVLTLDAISPIRWLGDKYHNVADFKEILQHFLNTHNDFYGYAVSYQEYDGGKYHRDTIIETRIIDDSILSLSVKGSDDPIEINCNTAGGLEWTNTGFQSHRQALGYVKIHSRWPRNIV